MPWPFRKRKDAAGASAPSPSSAGSTPATSTGRPYTAADFAPRRVAVPLPRAWATLPPIESSIAPVSRSLVVPAASFVSDVAGTQQLVQTPLLRQVSGEAPGGRADAIVTPDRSLPVPPTESGPAGPGAAQVGGTTARPLPGRTGRAPSGRLDAYRGPLQPVEPDRYDESGWDAGWYEEPEPEPGGIREELPPPIFSALLAERTGVPLTDIRPDLADTDVDSASAPKPSPTRRRSLAESRRLGLGAPQHSPAAQGEQRPQLPEDFDPTAPPDAEPDDEDDGDVEVVEESLSFEELATLRPFELPEQLGAVVAPPPPPEPEPERRPTLRYRPAPDAAVRRFQRTRAVPPRQAVPPDVRHAVERATGVDPGPADVRRGPEASAEATRIGALAFTRQGEIFLPSERGPIDAPETRAILAHELTHVVQHRVYGGRLPRRESPAGQALEAEARDVQRYVAGAGPSPRRAPRQETDDERRFRETAQAAVAAGLAHFAPDGTLVFGGGGTVAGGEDWMVSVSSDYREASREEQRLYEDLKRAQDANAGVEQAKSAYDEYREAFHRQFPEGAPAGSGPSAGPARAGSAASLEEQLAQLKAEHDLTGNVDYSDLGGMLFAGSFWEEPGAPDEAEYEKKKKELEDKIKAKRAGPTSGATPTTGTTPPAGTAPLIHAPTGGTPTAPALSSTTGTPTAAPGAATAAAERVVAERQAATQKVKTESERLQDELKTWQETTKLEEQLEQLKYEHSLTEDRGYADFAQTFVGGAFAGGVGGFFSALGGDLFSDPRVAEEEAAYEYQKKQLETQLAKQREIEAAQAAEKAQAQAQQAQAQAQAGTPAAAAGEPGAAATAAPAGAPGAAALAAAPVAAAAALAVTSPLQDLEHATREAAHQRGVGAAESEGAGNALLAQLADEDVEELASMLYNRLVTRLRRDLIIDRERAGLLTDFR